MQKLKNLPLKRQMLLIFVAAALAVAVLGAAVATTFASSSNIELSIRWNGTDAGITDNGQTFTYHATTNETRLVRMLVSFRSTPLPEEYPANSIIITVPGIRDAIRSGGAATPVAIAADAAGVPEAQRLFDWNFTYNSATDTFTFFNNRPVAAGAVFSGSFEIVWSVPARTSIDGAALSLQAQLQSTLGDSTQSNTITYIQIRERDQYSMQIAAARLRNADGLADRLPAADQNPANYTWVRYDVTGQLTYRALGVDGPERFDVLVPAGAVLVAPHGFAYVGPGETINGVPMNIWRLERNITALTPNPWWGEAFRNPLVVAFPHNQFSGNATIRMEAHGQYFDHAASERLAYAQVTIHVDDFGFDWVPGSLYAAAKSSFGMNNEFIRAHCGECYRRGAINSLHMSNGAREYTSRLFAGLNFPPAASVVFDIALYDDFMDVETTSGTLRRLRDDEYTFTRVTIPAHTSILGNNWQPITPNVYDVEIWVRYRGPRTLGNGLADFVRLTGGQWDNLRIGPTAHNLVLPANVVGVKVAVRGLAESIRAGDMAILHYIFHTDDNDIRLDNGRVINSFFIRLYQSTGSQGQMEWMNNEWTLENYTGVGGQRIYNYDMLIYGTPLVRRMSRLHVLEVPAMHNIRPRITRGVDTRETFQFLGELRNNFTFVDEDTRLNDFSVYTILPEGLFLHNTVQTGEDLLRFIDFSGTGIDTGMLQNNVAITIDRDFRGSGRTWIEFQFTNLNARPGHVTISNIPMYMTREDLPAGSFILRLEGMAIVDQPGRWHANGFDNRPGIWNDINQNGVTTNEVAAWYHDNLLVVIPVHTQLEASKLVQTGETPGFVLPWKAADGTYDWLPIAYAGTDYSYRLRLRLGYNAASHIVFADRLEDGPLAQWRGTFNGIDYSAAEALLGTPVVWYSPNLEPIVPEPNFASGAWTQTRPANVRSFAVVFPADGIAPAGSVVAINVHMTAPEGPLYEQRMRDPAYAPFLTENSFVAYYNELDALEQIIGREHLESNDVLVLLSPLRGTIHLHKIDATDNSMSIAGAVFSLYRDLGNGNSELVQADLTTNAAGRIRVDHLYYGDYYFVETTTPLGYLPPSPNRFPVTLMSENPNAQVTRVVENQRRPGQVTLRKASDLNENWPVQGAVFNLYYANGTLRQAGLTTNAQGQIVVNNLPWGSYYFLEITPAHGYTLSDPNEPIHFTIEAANDAGRLIALNITNPQVPADVILVKYDSMECGTQFTTEPVSGAVYALFRYNDPGRPDGHPAFGDDEIDQRIGTFFTDSAGQIHVTGLAFGHYYFLEVAAAQGYLLYENPIRFSLTEATIGTPAVERMVVTYNQRRLGNITLQKFDDEGVIVDGAIFHLYRLNADGTRQEPPLAIRTTGQEPVEGGGFLGQGIIYFTGLEWGDYVVVEVYAPLGYELDEKEFFVTIDRTTASTLHRIEAINPRERGRVELIKRSELAPYPLIEGAVFTLFHEDGTVFAEGLTTDAQGRIVVNDLPWGRYFFQETASPPGFGLNPELIRFAVNRQTAGVTQTLYVYNPTSSFDLTVTKRIQRDDIVFAHGAPSFLFNVRSIGDAGGAPREYNRLLVFHESALNLMPDAQGYIALSVIFANIPAGTYRVFEGITQRYELTDISIDVVTTDGTVSEDGTYATVTLGGWADSGEVIFTNQKYDQGSQSDNAAIINMIRRSRLLTAVTAQWTGPDGFSEHYFDRDYLIVYAHFDDGTSRRLGNHEYLILRTVNPRELAEPLSNLFGDFTFFVEYSEGGRTRRASFDVTIAVPETIPPFSFVMNTQLGPQEPNIRAFINNDNVGRRVQLSIGGHVDNNFTIEWGDGTITSHVGAASTNPVHTYASHGIYTITIRGTVAGHMMFGQAVTSWYMDREGNPTATSNHRAELRLIEVLTPLPHQPGRIGFHDMFSVARNLQSIPEDLLIRNPQATVFQRMFRTNTSLQSIPEGLFAHNPNAVNFDSTFLGCTALTQIPANLFYHNTAALIFSRTFYGFGGTIPETLFQNNVNATSFMGVFQGAQTPRSPLNSIPENLFVNNTNALDFSFAFGWTEITSIPPNLFANNTQATNFSNTFANTFITSIPLNLFANNMQATHFNSTFAQCMQLTSIEGSLFAQDGAATHFLNTFSNCTGLTTLPEDLFAAATQARYFNNTFSNCTGLTAIPPGLFAQNGEAREFIGTFHNCTGITAVPEVLFANSPHITNFMNAFLNTRLTYIPPNLFANNPDVTSFASTFSGSHPGSRVPITSVPEELFYHNKAVTSFVGTFQSTDLATVPAGLFAENTAVTNFGSVFGSARIAVIPQGLFDNNLAVTNFAGAFSSQTHDSVTVSIPADLFRNHENIEPGGFAGVFSDFRGQAQNFHLHFHANANPGWFSANSFSFDGNPVNITGSLHLNFGAFNNTDIFGHPNVTSCPVNCNVQNTP